jgi:hypothetical protein
VKLLPRVFFDFILHSHRFLHVYIFIILPLLILLLLEGDHLALALSLIGLPFLLRCCLKLFRFKDAFFGITYPKS